MIHKPAPLLGLAIGDAYGKPFEVLADQEAIPVPYQDPDLQYLPGRVEIVGPWGVPPGQFTDDTQMSLALATALLAAGTYDRETVLRQYVEWHLTRGHNEPRGEGGTIKKVLDWVWVRVALALRDSTQSMQGAFMEALSRLGPDAEHDGSHPALRANTSQGSGYVGSGTAMRAAPIGAFFSDEKEILLACEADAYLTHASREAWAGSFAVAYGVRLAMEMPANYLPDAIIQDVQDVVAKHFRYTRVSESLRHAWAVADSDCPYFWSFDPSGDVAAVVGSAFALFGISSRQDETSEVFQTSCHIGGDTDTRTAILGALLGARRGEEGLPASLIPGVERLSDLRDMDQRLVRLSRGESTQT